MDNACGMLLDFSVGRTIVTALGPTLLNLIIFLSSQYALGERHLWRTMTFRPR